MINPKLTNWLFHITDITNFRTHDILN
jgi:hypothetical protein